MILYLKYVYLLSDNSFIEANDTWKFVADI